ncbi:hypothetical protein SAMN02745248_00368 [Hathewaya proteolytica DSM 3090]|uniref:Uncharacterized protein n=1 Tax=Hathewaya proteolytica DSM 3090 TaxID=1121331 RepID=A0A1M6K7V9_9CLOT|nr:hypothetical protein [Hathewaya proteolytica]SHJ55076.1 hypothetical protein SAMN02745248_00368 [Hathewaya proteolytica DSM 3090]
MLKKQNVFLIGCIIMGIYGFLLKENDSIISAFILYISLGVWLKGIYNASPEVNKAKTMYGYIVNWGIFTVYYISILEIVDYYFHIITKNVDSIFSGLGVMMIAPIMIVLIISLYKFFKVRKEK